jgi:poly(A) polymerase Pap1
MAEVAKEDIAKEVKSHFFKSPVYAGLTVQVQKMVKQPDNSLKQEVAEQASFVQYYDMWKGDVIRVGYLEVKSQAIADLCDKDVNVERITEKEYRQAVEGDEKNPALKRAPVAAA